VNLGNRRISREVEDLSSRVCNQSLLKVLKGSKKTTTMPKLAAGRGEKRLVV
jgi:hypothetical protein